MAVIVRNALNNDRIDLPPVAGKSVKQAVRDSGFVIDDQFSVRDKNGHVIDQQLITEFDNLVVTVGMPGDGIRGGA
jgi:hypothetical protein